MNPSPNIHHLLTLALIAFGCTTTFSCRTAKTSERVAISNDATVACGHSETQSVSEWASFLRLLQLDSLEIVYTPYVVDTSAYALPPANRFAASTAAPPNHPPAAAKAPARIKAYGLHLSTSSEAQSAATLAASDSVNKSTQSTAKTEVTVKRTSPYYIYIAMAILTLIMAILAIIYFSRTRL